MNASAKRLAAVPNAAFEASFPQDVELRRPAGCYLARKMQQSLPAVAATVDDFDNWRDAGWAVRCEVGGQRFEVYFAGVGTGPVPTTDPSASKIKDPSELTWGSEDVA